jgi:hypothetical protein
MNLLKKILIGCAVPVLIFLWYLIFVFFPVHLGQEERCLAKGFPKTSTTVSLKGYCIDLYGSNSTIVKPLD